MSTFRNITAKELKEGHTFKIENPYGAGWGRAIVTKTNPKPKDYWIHKDNRSNEAEQLHVTYTYNGVGFYTSIHRDEEVTIISQ